MSVTMIINRHGVKIFKKDKVRDISTTRGGRFVVAARNIRFCVESTVVCRESIKVAYPSLNTGGGSIPLVV